MFRLLKLAFPLLFICIAAEDLDRDLLEYHDPVGYIKTDEYMKSKKDTGLKTRGDLA